MASDWRGNDVGSQDHVVAVEIFAANNVQGGDSDLFMAVSRQCGLNNADALMLDGLQMLAMRDRSVLPIDFPPLDEKGRERLVAWSAAGKQLPVAEFAARGLYNAYFLDLVVAQ